MIRKEHIEQILKSYFQDRVQAYKLIDNSWEDEYRYIAIVTTVNHGHVVVKCYSDPSTDSDKIDGWAHLALAYRQHGIHTPEFYRTEAGSYRVTMTVEGHLFYIWTEEFMPEKTMDDLELDMEDLPPDFLRQLGSCMGTMHMITLRNGMQYDWSSPYVLFDPEEENYEHALQLYDGLKDTEADTRLLEEIWEIYNRKRAELQSVFHALPAGGVQGDLSMNNILVDGNQRLAGLIDYNLAGNDKFLSYMMQEGIFLCFECYREEWLDREKCAYMEQRFKYFFDGYTEQYPLTQAERSHVNVFYNIIRPFRWDKVNITLGKAEAGLWQEVNERLQWMYRELTRDDMLDYLES
ncbi:phosphotransferase enzyme family protein [Paenibacillus apiarius]|uniref:phosphotransferase enzyme family protein n=1 Tax=Paenibacillus apiarius TaxID=46240 RepID=UPI0019803A5B|nr:phosphotransferase [Paenibacillus apiarius]MBN3526745.1 phosphotransferase [Paenibacillus apiarius]